MEYVQFFLGGLVFSAGFYSSGLMAGLHPITKPRLSNEDVNKIMQDGDYPDWFYFIGVLLSPILYLYVIYIGFTKFQFSIYIILATVILFHPVGVMIVRIFMSDKYISETIILFIILFIPIYLLFTYFF